MADDKETRCSVTANTSQYERAMKDMKRLSDETTGAMQSGWTLAKGPIIAAAAAFGAVTAAVYSFTQKAVESEFAQSRLGAVLKSTGQVAGYNLDQLKNMAVGLQGVSTASNTTLLSGMSILATFKNVRGEAFEGTMMAALNLSDVLGKDLNSSLIQLGRAMNNPAQGLNSLRRIGIQFSEEQKEQIKTMQKHGDLAGAQALILGELESKFGGAAKAARDTFGGALKATENTFSSLAKEIGFGITQNEAWINLVKDVETAMKGAIQAVKDNKDEIKKWADAVAGSLDVALKLAELIGKIGLKAYQASKYIAEMGMSLQTEVTAPYAALPGGKEGKSYGVTGSWEPEAGPPKPAPYETDATGGSGFGGMSDKDVEEMVKRMQAYADAEMETQIMVDTAREEYEAGVRARYLELELTQQNIILGMEADLSNKLLQMESARSQSEIDLAKKTAKAKMDATAMTLDNLIKTGKLMMETSFQGNKIIFEIVKAASIGQAIMSTYTGAANAMRDVPYPFNFLAAASVIAYGMAQVASIRSQSMESTGGGMSAGVPSVSASTAPIYEPLTIPTELDATQEKAKPIVNIYLEGGLITSPDGVEWLAGIISEAVENADVRLIATSARSAEALA